MRVKAIAGGVGLMMLFPGPFGAQESGSETARSPASFRAPVCGFPCALPPQSVRRLARDLTPFLRHWQENGELIGRRKRRRLEVARFHVLSERFDHRLADDPAAYEQARDIVRASLLKLARERFEDSPPMEFLVLRNESLRREGEEAIRSWPLRASPRLDLGSDAYLGVNLRPHRVRGAFWPHFAAGFRERLGRNASSIFLQFEDERRRLRLEQESAATGDTLSLTVLWGL